MPSPHRAKAKHVTCNKLREDSFPALVLAVHIGGSTHGGPLLQQPPLVEFLQQLGVVQQPGVASWVVPGPGVHCICR